jgi:pimeloyl-ACP methyl ester carboxylesterase
VTAEEPAPERSALHTGAIGEQGSWVVFCHGLFGQGKNWTQVAKALAAGDDPRRSLLVDLPDHGRSPWSRSFDFLAQADQVADAIRTTGGDPVALVGHSLGGKIAMVVALRHPELVERLCVVDVAPVRYHHSEEFAGYLDAMLGVDLDTLDRPTDADEALADAVPNRVVRSFLLQNLRHDDAGWRWQPNLALLRAELDTLADWPEALAAAPPYERPVLWVAGERSDYVTDEYAEAMSRLFPRVLRVTVRDAGHWVHSEQQESFVAVLRRFLDAAGDRGQRA